MSQAARFALAGEGLEAATAARFAVAAAPDPDGGPPPPAQRPRRRGRALGDTVDGTFWAVVLSVDGIAAPAPPASVAPRDAEGSAERAVGVVELRWRLLSSSSCNAATDHNRALSSSGPPSGRVGYMQYEVIRSEEFAEPVLVTAREQGVRGFSVGALRDTLLDTPLATGQPLRSRLGRQRVDGFVDVKADKVPAALRIGAVLRSLALKKRSAPAKQLIRGGPGSRHVASWIRRQPRIYPQGQANSSRTPDPLLYVPRVRAREPGGSSGRPAQLDKRWRPETVFKAIKYTANLTDQELFVSSLRAAEEYMDDVGARPLDGPRVRDVDHASTSTLRRSIMKMDAVSCLVERREFAAFFQEDKVRSVHFYADGSPVVGHELQAMMMDLVLRDGTLTHHILPAVTLGYAMTSALDKMLALLWVLWLVLGPSATVLLKCLELCISVTTDQGTEASMVDVVDIAAAFMKSLAGGPIHALGDLVRIDRPLLPRAMRIPGWQHMCAGLSKYVCKLSPSYPVYLAHMQALTSAMRIGTWREHLHRLFPDKDFTVCLARPFTGNFIT